MQDNIRSKTFSLAERIGVMALIAALLLFLVSPFLAFVPLSSFLLLCFAAPFFPKFGFYLPVISRGKSGAGNIALTFDDGPAPASTPILLDLLAKHNLEATFFVLGKKAAKYPDLIKDILAQGHTIGNHSWNHDYFLMLHSQERLQKDIQTTQEILKESGIQPLIFRPPVGITGPRLGAVLSREGLITVNYSCRAFDRGNRNILNLARKIQKKLQSGDIIMLHDLPPYNKKQVKSWQKEIDQLFGFLKKNYQTVPLEQLIEHPVMLCEKRDAAL